MLFALAELVTDLILQHSQQLVPIVLCGNVRIPAPGSPTIIFVISGVARE